MEGEGEKRLMLPTSDVCARMMQSKFSSKSVFSTPGICGRIDVCCENNDGALVISLEDPVGYSAIQLTMGDGETTAKAFMEKYELLQGAYVFIKGILEIQSFSEGENAVLRGFGEHVDILPVSEKDYHKYLNVLLDTPESSFAGNVPETR